MYVVEDDEEFDVCWYIVRVVEKQTFYVHKVSRRDKTTRFVWSHQRNKAIRFLTTRGISRFITDYNLSGRCTFVLIEKGGAAQGIVPVDTF